NAFTSPYEPSVSFSKIICRFGNRISPCLWGHTIPIGQTKTYWRKRKIMNANNKSPFERTGAPAKLTWPGRRLLQSPRTGVSMILNFSVITAVALFSARTAIAQLGSLANTDGAFPAAGLVLSGNTLYGTAQAGGHWGNGVVFAVKADGSGFTTLRSF